MQKIIFYLCVISYISTTTSSFAAQYPLPFGKITSSVGWRKDPFKSGKYKYHRGVDIAAPIGTPVYATEIGRVHFAGWNPGGYGWLVVIDHLNGYYSMYGHNSRLYVHTGQYVNLQTVLAAVGSTGRSTGPHLHYEVRYWPKAQQTTYQHR